MRANLIQFIQLAVVLLLSAALPGCSRGPALPDIVLITIDTLRADHLSCYGYGRPTSPFIDAIAAEGTLFHNACATSSWTSPSMASLFVSLYPRSNGVLHGFIESGGVENQELLSPAFTTIAEILKEHGYRTFGITTNGHMAAGSGFEQGFDRYVSIWFEDGAAANNAALDLRDELDKSSPFFLWVHYFDPHAPYYAREPWIGRYNQDRKSCAAWSGMNVKKLREMKNEIIGEPGALRALEDLYDSEINYTDECLEKLFEDLPLRENSLVVITSDHGETFLDHNNLIGHGKSLFEEVVRVPLIVKLPGGGEAAARTVERPVSIIDVYPTILESAGIPMPDGLQGRSLLPLIAGRPAEEMGPLYAELDRGFHQKAVRLGSWKYICRGPTLKKESLYNIREDPEERFDVAGKEREVAGSMREKLSSWMAENPPFKAEKAATITDESQRKTLRALGYLN